MSSDMKPIEVEQAYDASVAKVWDAITDQKQMREWYFDAIANFEPVIGFETQFVVNCEGQDFSHHWKVTEVIPLARISYAWRYGGYQGDSVVTWDLAETPSGSKLKLTHLGIETFPQDNPIFSRESGQAGWEYFLRTSLKAYLDH